MTLLTPTEAAEELHHTIDAPALIAALRARSLDPIKIGKRLYVTRDMLKVLLTCPAAESPRDCGSVETDAGSSSTEESTSGPELAEAMVGKLLKRR